MLPTSQEPYKVNVARKTDISLVEVSARLTVHGVLVCSDSWGVLGETVRKICI